MAKKIPEIDSSSQADIAFLLLLFYLMASTMNVDSGIYRMLPPWVDEDNQDDANKVKERNLLKISINSRDELFVAGRTMDISQLKAEVQDFILNPTSNEELPEKVVEEIDLIGEYPVSQGVVSLLNTRETSYNMYIQVQNELNRAVNELRDALAMQHFGKVYKDLNGEEQKAIASAIPNKISEAEPLETKK